MAERVVIENRSTHEEVEEVSLIKTGPYSGKFRVFYKDGRRAIHTGRELDWLLVVKEVNE